ncbi:hypothetical protein Tco_1120960, partial [Tanacetum coccineum]
CKTVGQILLDHPLSYALTTTVDVLVVYLQQFKLDSQEITYIVVMFHDTLKLPVETPDNPFIAPVNIKVIESFIQTVGYQGVVDKVSAFYTKFLAQLWQTMFKVFNRCLTTRTSGHDQTKINILQLFHVVVNRTNVDYAALLWWDFINGFPSIPKRLDEDYHSIKDDNPLVSVYSTRNVLFRGMLIPDAFVTNEIHATDDYKEYETVFVGVEVPMNQPQPVVSTQGTHRTTPRAHRTPTLTTASPQGKKRKQSARETSSPRKLLKVTIRKNKQSKTPIPPLGDDRERDEMAEATLLSLTLYKTALAAEAQENIAKVQDKLDEEEIEKMVEGEQDEESYASEFVDSMLNDDVDDSGTNIEPESHKENPEVVDDDVTKKKDDKKVEDEVKDDDVEKTDDAAEEKDNDDHTDHTLVRTHATDSMATRNEQIQTPILTPNRSSRKDLSLNKTIFQELTATVSPTTATKSKSKSKRGFISNKTNILPGSIAGMCRRRGQIRNHIKTKFVTREFFMGKIREVLDHCNSVVPEVTFAMTNEMIKKKCHDWFILRLTRIEKLLQQMYQN